MPVVAAVVTFVDGMSLVSTIALALGASWASGIRLYAAVATLGIMSRLDCVTLPGNLTVVENPYVIGVAGVMFTEACQPKNQPGDEDAACPSPAHPFFWPLRV